MTARRPYLIGLASCVLSSSLQAQPADTIVTTEIGPRPAAAAPARAAPNRAVRRLEAEAPPVAPIDSVAKDLQKIVVLCATDPASEGFKTEWARYVETHAVAAENLDGLIDDVIAKANAYRAERSSNSRTNRMLTIMTSTREMMHDTAMAVIRKIG